MTKLPYNTLHYKRVLIKRDL